MELKYMILYAEVNLLCVLLLAIVLFKVLTRFDMQHTQRIFVKALIGLMIFFLADACWYFIDDGFWQASRLVNYLVNALYYIQAGLSAFLWFYYSETVQRSSLVDTWRKRLLCALPLMVLVGLVLISYWTGWSFYIDADNHYHRGPLYMVQMLIAYGYPLFTAVKAFILAQRKDRVSERTHLLTLASFVAPPTVFGVFQTLFTGIPLLCIGITLSVLNVYFTFQEEKISVDSLTQVNNRTQLFRFLPTRMAQYADSRALAEPGQQLYLMMADVDYFKQINDRYGHVEGDRALTLVAEALRRICADTSFFVARYGGDEFLLLCELPGDREAEALCEKLHQTLAQVHRDAEARYPLGVSIGYAAYDPDMALPQDFIAAADGALYRSKQSRR